MRRRVGIGIRTLLPALAALWWWRAHGRGEAADLPTLYGNPDLREVDVAFRAGES